LASLERDHIPSPRPIAAREIPLIDRLEEMKLLKEAVDGAIQGEGGVVFLHGEAGIGKTRLTRELGAYARLRGMQVLYGRCPALFRMDGVPPYVLWSEVLRDYLESCSPEQLYRVVGFYPSEVAKLVPELRQKLGTIPQSLPLGPEHERDRLFEAVFQFIVNVSKEAPLLVILDDLQWTDQTSLLLLQYLSRGIFKTPLLLLGAYRDTDVDEKHPLSPVLAELNRERLSKPISLRRMSSADVSEMIRQILEQEEVPKEFCGLVYGKTRGNPFFVEEVIRSLKEEDIIFHEENRWKIREVSKIEFPATVKSVIKTRISRLDDESQNILTMASFIGNDFTFEAVQGVTGIEESKLLELMERLLKTGLIKEKVIRGEDVYSFSDVMVRDVVHEEVSHLRHRKLHGSVGNALEKVYASNLDEHLGELAYHFLEAGDKDKALDYFLKAGERAWEIYAPNEAFSYFLHALELLEEHGDDLEKKARIIERLGGLKWWMGELQVCLQYWNRALDLWDQLEDKKNTAKLHGWMGNLFWQLIGDTGEASKHQNMALEILQKEPESVELAGLYENISHMLWRSGKPGALSWAQKAFELAERLGNQEVLTACYNDFGVISLKSGEYEKALKYFEQGLKLALKNNSPWSLNFYNNLASLYWSMGELQRSFEISQKRLEFARKVGALYAAAWAEVDLALSYMYMGEIQRAMPILEEVLAFDKRVKYTSHVSSPLTIIGACYLFLGELEKSLQYLKEAYDMARATKEYQFFAETGCWLGRLFIEMEDYAEAEKYLDESNSKYQEAGDTDTQVISVLPELSRLYLKKGATQEANKLIERIYEYASKTHSKLVVPQAEMLRAMLFREQKDWEQSIRHFENSLQGYKALDAQKRYVEPLADLLCEYGSTYLARDEEGDEERAFSLLNKTLDVYQEMGAIKRVEKIRSMTVRKEKARKVIKFEPAEEGSKGASGHIATGYAGLDRLLCGGIPENYTVALTSPSCDERELLVKSFLEAGAKKGEVAFHVTINPGSTKGLVDEYPSSFYLVVCNPQADAIARDAPNVVKLKGVENLTDISIALTSGIRNLDPSQKGPRRICIGLISDVLLQHHAVQTRRWLAGLIPELQSEGFTTMAVMDSRIHPPEELYAIVGLFDGEINIRERETEKGTARYLKIQKMSNQKYLEDELPLRKEQS
jgi:tetratricopeptide (TPR) repeat protein/KaiC/GvpD/RAD55 family RecA-like ATPase